MKNNEECLFNRRKTEKKEINFVNNKDDKKNKEQNYISPNKNRRGNARNFLENFEGFNFGESQKKKSNEILGNNNFNINIGNSGGEFGSFFGNKSRRKQDKNYEI